MLQSSSVVRTLAIACDIIISICKWSGCPVCSLSHLSLSFCDDDDDDGAMPEGGLGVGRGKGVGRGEGKRVGRGEGKRKGNGDGDSK